MKGFLSHLLCGAAIVASATADMPPQSPQAGPASTTATTTAVRGRRLDDVPCDPDRCVLATFTFGEGRTECSSCMPENGKYRCPAVAGGNVYGDTMDQTFAGGFGNWNMAQCEHDSYSPSILAFSGPGAWDDHFVPACPPANVCACGEARDKIKQLMSNRNALSRREQNDLYWASMAPGFDAMQGFTSVSGGSVEHFDLVYSHGDGRRQFCSYVQSFTYSPQQSGPHTHRPNGYTTGGSWFGSPSCADGFRVASTETCFWWSKKAQCEPVTQTEATAAPAPGMAATTDSEWGPWGAWGTCSKGCGGGEQWRRRPCSRGTGTNVDKFCDGDSSESRACNTQTCQTTTSSCGYWPSCPSGYTKTGTSRSDCWWPRSRATCVQS